MDIRTRWYSRREVNDIANGFAVTEHRRIIYAHLYDRDSQGRRCSGAYGANLIGKLAAAIGWTEDAVERALQGNND